MGIKNFHIFLIFSACTIGILFSGWALLHQENVLAFVSLCISMGLIIYGINFIRKAKALLQK